MIRPAQLELALKSHQRWEETQKPQNQELEKCESLEKPLRLDLNDLSFNEAYLCETELFGASIKHVCFQKSSLLDLVLTHSDLDFSEFQNCQLNGLK